MNELDKLLELAGIIVGAGDFDPRNKKDDAGITIDDMQINHDGCDAGNEGHEDNENQLSFTIDKDEDEHDGYEDLGFGIAEKYGKQTEDGVDEEIQRMSHLAGIQENDDVDDTDTEEDEKDDLPQVGSRDAKPEPDFAKKYDDWYWDGKEDKEFKEGIEDEVEDDSEIVNFEPDSDEDGVFSDKPKVGDAKPEPDFAKKYDDWYWDGKGDKTFSEEDDLSNGYGKEETFDKDDMFPNGFDTPISNSKGPASARQGDNPMNWRNKMAVKESLSRSLYQELINFKKKD